MYNYNYPEDYLMHYGIKGMKWGKRKASYQTIGNRVYSRAARASQKDADNLRKHGYKAEADAVQKVADRNRAKASASQKKYDERNTPEAKAKRAKALKIGAAVAGTALAAYGAKKVHDMVRDKNRDIRVGKELAEANFLLRSNSLSESNYGKGFTNDQIKYRNDQFNKLSKQMLDNAKASGNRQADRDSFRTAAKNVYDDYRKNRKR